jgi:hypothetical protein
MLILTKGKMLINKLLVEVIIPAARTVLANLIAFGQGKDRNLPYSSADYDTSLSSIFYLMLLPYLTPDIQT